MFKRGDFVQSTRKNKVGKLFIVLKAVPKQKLLITVPISINKKIGGKWVCEYKNGQNTFYIKYDILSNLNINNVKLYDLSLYNSYELVSFIYDIRKENEELIKEERRNLIRAKMKKKQEINGLSKQLNKKEKITTDYKKRPGLHDPLYKGNITIVRG